MAAVTPTLDIFIGGPMFAPDDPRLDAAGGLMAHHLDNLENAVKAICGELNDELGDDLEIRTFSPPRRGGAGLIPPEVFDRIDECDFGIFDFSGPAYASADGQQIRQRASPNVVYELGLMHSLGLATMVVDFGGGGEFYLSQCYNCQVADYSVETLTRQLRDPIRSVIASARSPQTLFFSDGLGETADENPLHNPALNPITAHYQMPLVELASSAGLATGYFRNFVLDIFKNRFALKYGEHTPDGTTSQLAGQPFRYSHIIMLEPDHLEETEDVRDHLRTMLREPAIVALELSHEMVELESKIDETRTRTKTMYAVGTYLYDIPTTLIASTLSPRYQKIAEWQSGRRPDRSAMIAKRENEIKRAFFATVRRLAEKSPDCPRANAYLRVLTIYEFRDRLLDGGMDRQTRF